MKRHTVIEASWPIYLSSSRSELTNSSEPIKRIEIRRSKSGAVTFSNPVVLYLSRYTRKRIVPMYVPHNSKPSQLACKLVEEHMESGRWEEKAAISLDEATSAKLLEALENHAVVAEHSDEGTLYLIQDHGARLASDVEDPEPLVSAILRLLKRPDILSRFASGSVSGDFANVVQAAIRVEEIKSAIRDLKGLLDREVDDEKTYQDWCENNTWAFGNAHTTRDEIRRTSRTDTVDLLLPRVLTGYRDVVELKRPSMTPIAHDKGHNSWYWTTDASKAIGQSHVYMDNLHEDANRGLRDKPEVVAYHPRSTIVMGHSNNWDLDEYRALAGLNERLSGITIMTYDQLLAQGAELVRVLEQVQKSTGEPATVLPVSAEAYSVEVINTPDRGEPDYEEADYDSVPF
jgi:hypothetical protein